jgi:RNA 2',3'-cyclic 3'-phosphodiesterase
MRLFVAVELPRAVRAAAGAAGRRLAATLAPLRIDARWIPEGNLHITLWFLGEVPQTRLDALREACREPLAITPFVIRLGGVGMFPPSGPPRVIWMGVIDRKDGLEALHAELSARLSPLGFEPDRRPFNPHLTLARIRARPPRASWVAARQAVATQAIDAGSSPVEAVTLFRSHLSPQGSAYESLLRVPLG